jgi:hypothetical protein
MKKYEMGGTCSKHGENEKNINYGLEGLVGKGQLRNLT